VDAARPRELRQDLRCAAATYDCSDRQRIAEQFCIDLTTLQILVFLQTLTRLPGLHAARNAHDLRSGYATSDYDRTHILSINYF
jgi:hypothetical protein